jgi:hippurate hydrolase
MTAYPRIAEYLEDMTIWRRDIHAHPELCFEEVRTSAIVVDKLRQWGIDVHTGLAKTGVVGTLRGRGEGRRSIALRADMDALPLQEATRHSYKSCFDGKMHACGHDGHTVMLLGAARYLAETRNFDGTVYFIFQPAEEEGGGAKVMMDEGLFEKFPCDSIYGMHNSTGTPAGTFAIKPNAFFASADTAMITITGKGGHAAWPERCNDPIATGVQLYNTLQTIISRNTSPLDKAVLSISMFNSGTTTNVIADTATLGMTIRALNGDTRAMIRQRIFQISEGLAQANGTKITVDYHDGYPVLVNDPEHTTMAADVAASIVGEDNVERNTDHVMGSEDFAYMLEEKPGAYIWIGQNDRDHSSGLHHPAYDFNDTVLTTGASYWAAMVEQSLPA